MLRTCGLTQEEFLGKDAHDLASFYHRLKDANPETQPQRRAQAELPGSSMDMVWLKQAYLAARYPNASHGQLPSSMYHAQDAERAARLAREVVQWARVSEDLPVPICSPAQMVERVEEVPMPAQAPPAGPRVPEESDEPTVPTVPVLGAQREPLAPVQTNLPPPLLTAPKNPRVPRIQDQEGQQRLR